jgi:hypothetical protein
MQTHNEPPHPPSQTHHAAGSGSGSGSAATVDVAALCDRVAKLLLRVEWEPKLGGLLAAKVRVGSDCVEEGCMCFFILSC